MTTSPASPATPAIPSTVELHFDPACPWTWLTSRWLVDAAPRRGITVVWRSLSLLVLNDGDPPEQYAVRVRAAGKAHRLFAALDAAGRNELIGDVYAAAGARVHDGGEELTDDLVREAAAAAGAGEWLAALDEERWDDAVELATKTALDLAGPDVGSPVLVHGSPPVGVFGPIVNPGPRGDDAARLLDHVLALSQTDGFFELKRGRSSGPVLPAPPSGD